METIRIEEIPVEEIDEFWKVHFRYLVEDGIIEDEEDREYTKMQLDRFLKLNSQ